MFKRTGWFAMSEPWRARGGDDPSPISGPYDSAQSAADDARAQGYVVGQVVFFDWDSPDSVCIFEVRDRKAAAPMTVDMIDLAMVRQTPTCRGCGQVLDIEKMLRFVRVWEGGRAGIYHPECAHDGPGRPHTEVEP